MLTKRAYFCRDFRPLSIPLLLLLLLLLPASTFASRPFFQSIWRGWKMANSKIYPTLREERLRMRIFISNYMFIRWHNQRYYLGLETYSTALNAFADLTLKEFAEKYLTLDQTSMQDYWQDMDTQYVEQPMHLGVPASVDWRKKGLVTPIKNQGPCGSCWAFSATGALEGQYKKKKGNLVAFSEQQLVDCSRSAGNEGCNGGYMNYAFKYWMQNGAESERDYPYTAMDGRCNYNRSKAIIKVKKFVKVLEKSEQQLGISVAKFGPVSVGIDASSQGFMFYEGGIFQDPTCSEDVLDHGVLVVGYDVDTRRRKYWIVKNSWGEQDKGNMCGIATLASHPLI
ncbi:Procathepsin L [Taenia crassiceps]|uniref:Procathepsin L n=1 Tax=Taenia crassiceps TaxID=6207 RepID=A0ABR4Q0I7_9CEST